MANIKMSPLAESLNGKIGGLVFSRVKGGIIVKSLPESEYESTPNRVERAEAYGRLVQIWRSLHQDIKDCWDLLAEISHLSGMNLFIQANLAKETAHDPIELLPPVFDTDPLEGYSATPPGNPGQYHTDWSPWDPDTGHTVWTLIRMPGQNEIESISKGVIDVADGEFNFYNSPSVMSDSGTPGGPCIAPRGLSLPSGVLSINCRLDQTVADAGHNYNILNPAEGDEERGIEIALGSDEGDISVFLTGEKNENWDTYKEVQIDNDVVVGECFNLTVEWYFNPPNSTFSVWVDGVEPTGGVTDRLSNWSTLYSPTNFGFFNDLPPYDDRFFEGPIYDIAIYPGGLDAHLYDLLARGQQFAMDALLYYDFRRDGHEDYSPYYHTLDITSGWSIATSRDTRDAHIFSVVEPPSDAGDLPEYSPSVVDSSGPGT